ncbi:tumor necrosis factor receptor superfamily member 1A [Brienomyrus brachyistius]|uniref:tumor necrosis factor receptor superfamily member 1A n=1 Tax=Brienomyrus brachyistius TaxID=42636 RepID=UPI0020B354BE|nr:tumor necrosis factor receptor superfamily member 1A [Brienomyrus brachyistius]
MKLTILFFLWVVPLSLASLVPMGSAPAIKKYQPLNRAGRLAVHEEVGGTELKRTKRNPTECEFKCPPGSYKSLQNSCTKQRSHCSPCEHGTYTIIENQSSRCYLCTSCDEKASQVVKINCTSTSDTKCDCKEGYQRYNHSEDTFECERIDKPTPTVPTTKATQTRSTLTAPADPTGKIPDQPELPHHILLIMTIGFLLLGVTLVLTLRCCTQLGRESNKQHFLKSKLLYTTIQLPQEIPNYASPSQLFESPEPLVQIPLASGNAAKVNRAGPLDQRELLVLREESLRSDWPAWILYAIIEKVPVRRWKEFLRLLRVPDGQMERAELEAGPSYLEQQYQMLRLWSRRAGVQLADVYNVLQNMDLSGCAQDLRDKLEQQDVPIRTRSPAYPASGWDCEPTEGTGDAA